MNDWIVGEEGNQDCPAHDWDVTVEKAHGETRRSRRCKICDQFESRELQSMPDVVNTVSGWRVV